MNSSSVPVPDVLRYVHRRGLVAVDRDPEVTTLVGGVSGVVIRVGDGSDAFVIKRALERLDVAAEWWSKPERALTDAEAMSLCHSLTPAHTPQVLDIDVDKLTFSMSAAPPGWLTWKSILLGESRPAAETVVSTAHTLGSVLGTWHRTTWHDADVARRFADYEGFEQLRLTPFHRATAEKHPRLRDQLLSSAQELLEAQDCLVHGDFSPKNVLVGDGIWVLDFEVAHVGAPVFDLAFMLSHLMLKAIHRPARAELMATAGDALSTGYRDALGPMPVADSLARHIACLLLARVDGMSPAPYLTRTEGACVRELSTTALLRGDQSLHQLWARVRAAARSLAGI